MDMMPGAVSGMDGMVIGGGGNDIAGSVCADRAPSDGYCMLVCLSCGPYARLPYARLRRHGA